VLSLNQPSTTTLVAAPVQPSVSGYIQGSVNIVSPSSFMVVGEIFYPLYIIGNVTGTNLITFGSEKSTAFAPFPLDIQGTATPAPGLTITSPNNTTFTVGTAGSFPVTATGVPTPTVIESSTDTLPSGVTFNAATGVLSGTPAAGTGGTYSLHFTAVNTVGSSPTQTFTLTVS
ncbi:MAG: Ig domain-containing protein, partial [Isosphaeraceae bacterium]